MIANRIRAFTLMELMLSMVIIMMVVVMVYSFYSYSLNFVSTSREHLAETQLARVVLDHIAGELRSSPGVGADFGPILIGRRDGVSFLTTVVPSRMVFFPKYLMEESLPIEHDLRRVEYGLAVDEEDVVHGLRRFELRVMLAPKLEKKTDEELIEESEEVESHEDIQDLIESSIDEAVNKEEEADVQIVSETIRYIEFMYFDGTEWLGEWAENVLPRAIRIVIGFEQVPESELAELQETAWDERPWRDDQYSLLVSLQLSEELKTRSTRLSREVEEEGEEDEE